MLENFFFCTNADFDIVIDMKITSFK